MIALAVSGFIVCNGLGTAGAADLFSQISRGQRVPFRDIMRLHPTLPEDTMLYFAEHGYDPIFGARPLRRLIEEKLVDEIAMQILENKVKPGDTISPTVKDGKIVL